MGHLSLFIDLETFKLFQDDFLHIWQPLLRRDAIKDLTPSTESTPLIILLLTADFVLLLYEEVLGVCQVYEVQD